MTRSRPASSAKRPCPSMSLTWSTPASSPRPKRTLWWGVTLPSTYAEFVALRIEHDGPTTSVALPILDLRRAESDQALDLVPRGLRGQVDMHPALGRFGFGNPLEQHAPDASVIGCSQSHQVILFGDRLIARDF